MRPRNAALEAATSADDEWASPRGDLLEQGSPRSKTGAESYLPPGMNPNNPLTAALLASDRQRKQATASYVDHAATLLHDVLRSSEQQMKAQANTKEAQLLVGTLIPTAGLRNFRGGCRDQTSCCCRPTNQIMPFSDHLFFCISTLNAFKTLLASCICVKSTDDQHRRFLSRF